MPRPKARKSRWIAGLALLGCALTAGAATYGPRLLKVIRKPDVIAEDVPRVAVRRADFDVRLTAGGRVESAKKTLIECEIENLAYSNEGRSLSASNPTILEVIPEGTMVRRDDVLCRLDSSDYEELVRQQEIKLRQARNDHDKAQLDVNSAELALKEYREGNLPQQLQAMEGQIVLAQSDVRRQQDRLVWAERMLKNGYFSLGQMVAENDRMMRAEILLRNTQSQRILMQKFTAPIATMRLEMQVSNARSQLSFQDLRLRRMETLMAKFRRQVELCTVRAPHDGMVIYANEGGQAPKVEIGARVFQKMDLFFLPDLNDMEVAAVLNESVIDRVKENQTVRVRIESLPDFALEGHVVSIAPLPLIRKDQGMVSDIRSYLSRIQLHSSAKGLLPGMTAEVDIQTARTDRALVVPPEAVMADHGHDYCIVENRGGLERREVTIGQGSRELLEIRSGLQEGERIIRDPSLLDDEAMGLALQTRGAEDADGEGEDEGKAGAK